MTARTAFYGRSWFRLADEPDGFAAGDLALVVPHADYLGDDEAHEAGLAVAAAVAGGGGGHGGGGEREGLGWGMGFKTLNWWRRKSSKGCPFRASRWGSVQDWGIFLRRPCLNAFHRCR
jgi:hypothetical protein